MSVRSGVVSGVLVAVFGLGGCAQGGGGERTLDFKDGNGYVQFVNHDGAPNTVFHVRKVSSVTVSDGIFYVTGFDQKQYVVPAARMVYAGFEFE